MQGSVQLQVLLGLPVERCRCAAAHSPPKQPTLMAQTEMMPRSLLTTRVASASPVTSSAMISSGRFTRVTCVTAVGPLSVWLSQWLLLVLQPRLGSADTQALQRCRLSVLLAMLMHLLRTCSSSGIISLIFSIFMSVTSTRAFSYSTSKRSLQEPQKRAGERGLDRCGHSMPHAQNLEHGRHVAGSKHRR